jgi:hypothetical protein
MTQNPLMQVGHAHNSGDTQDDTPKPRDIVDKPNRETLKALQEPKVRDKPRRARLRADDHGAAEYAAHVEKEVAVNVALNKAAGITPRRMTRRLLECECPCTCANRANYSRHHADDFGRGSDGAARISLWPG